MSPSDPPGPPFQVSFSGVMAEAIRQLQRQASREGRGEDFLSAVRAVVERLRQDPLGFGEPLYRLPVLGLQVRCGAVRPLYVDFAVCEDRPLVFLKAVKLLSQQDT
jgi:hypothetical protein